MGAPEVPATPRPDTAWGRLSGTVLAYIALTKPRVIELLLVATIPAMLFADRGSVDIVLILSTCSAGGWVLRAQTRSTASSTPTSTR